MSDEIRRRDVRAALDELFLTFSANRSPEGVYDRVFLTAVRDELRAGATLTEALFCLRMDDPTMYPQSD